MGQEKMSQSLLCTAIEVTLGIDISKQSLHTHLHPPGTAQRFTNDQAGITALIAQLKLWQPGRIVFEATGAYHRALERALGEAGLPAVKINPLQARRFAEATGKRVKTDAVDAAMLARFGAPLHPELPPARDPTIDALRELKAARDALIKDRTAALNRAKTLTLDLLQRQNQQRLTHIESQIAAIDHDMMQRQAEQAAL